MTAKKVIATFIGLSVFSYAFGKSRKMPWPVNGVITSGYGYRTHPINGTRSLHNGVDIAASINTKITSPANGTVSSIWLDAQFGGGNSMLIKHQNGFTTGYAHLNSYAPNIKKGTKVKKGDIIAYVGNTGISTGPHLHFTLRNEQGNIVNPESYFK